jgi:hypothetical protein
MKSEAKITNEKSISAVPNGIIIYLDSKNNEYTKNGFFYGAGRYRDVKIEPRKN